MISFEWPIENTRKIVAEQIKNRLAECVNAFTFDYHNKRCGVDPYGNIVSGATFEMWCGDDDKTVYDIDEVMTTPFFDGKSLSEIAIEIEIDEF